MRSGAGSTPRSPVDTTRPVHGREPALSERVRPAPPDPRTRGLHLRRPPAYHRTDMTDRIHSPSSNGAGSDLDAAETSEWLEALDAVVAHDGPARARDLLQ